MSADSTEGRCTGALKDLEHAIGLITFDCYGTLIDWELGITSTLRRLWGVDGPGRADLIESYIRAEASIQQQGYRPYREVQALALRALAASYRFDLPARNEGALAEALPDWPPFPDTNDALERLKSRYRLGVLSNIDRDLFARTCAHFNVSFDLVVTAEDVRSYKPAHPHFIQMLQQAPDVPRHAAGQEQEPDRPDGAPSRGTTSARGVLHVAQSLYHDGQPAAELNINYVWINRYGQTRPQEMPMLAEFFTLASLANALGV